MENFRIQLHEHRVYHVDIIADSMEDAMDTAEADPYEYIEDGSALSMSEWIDVEEVD